MRKNVNKSINLSTFFVDNFLVFPFYAILLASYKYTGLFINVYNIFLINSILVYTLALSIKV